MTVRAGLGADGRRGGVQELSHVGGVVRDADGEPVADAWVAVPGLGRMTTSNADGRFRIPGVAGGTYAVKVRDATGREAEAEVTVPSGMLDVVLATTASGKSR
jgi:protocatechuate 3,4-dioxygenase beta subunit